MADGTSFSILEKGTGSIESVGIINQVVDFGRGVIKGGVEDPVNGLIQIGNKLAGTELSELQIVDSEKASRSVGGLIGNFVGKAADYALLTMASQYLPATKTTTGAILRSGAIGAIYGGALTPSDFKSETFWADRVKNGAITFATFSAMGAAGAKLDSTGIFNVPEARGLFASMAYGATTGAAGGLANAEANAILNQGRIVPTVENLVKDVLTWSAFGAVSGSVNYGVHQYNAKYIDIETTPGQGGIKGSIQVQLDSTGRPVKVAQYIDGGDYGPFGWFSQLKTNGKWLDTKSGAYNQPVLTGIKIEPNGTVITRDGYYNNRYYTNGARFDSDRGRARELAELYAKMGAPTTSTMWSGNYESRAPENVKLTNTGWITLDEKTGAITQTVRTDNNLGQRAYDAAGRITSAVPDWQAGRSPYHDTIHWRSNGYGKNMTTFNYENNMLTRISSNDLSARQSAPNQWEMHQGFSKYKIEGKFEILKAETPNGIEQLKFVNKTGATTQIAANDHVGLGKILQSNAVIEPGATGYHYIKVNNDGVPTLVTNKNSGLTVNGKRFEHGAETVLKPGDQVIVNVDIGDRYTIMKTFDFTWIKDATQNLIGTTKIEPGKAFDLVTR